jgi:hypothetical protein
MTDINKYCSNPLSFDFLPEETRKYFDHICELKATINTDWKKELEKLGIAVVEFPAQMIASILTPSGLEMLGIFLGIDLSSKVALNGILRGIARGVGPEVMEAASALAIEQGAWFMNNAIMTTVLTEAVEEGSLAALALSTTVAISEAISTAASVVGIVQILAAIVDAWDPEGYGQELNAETMEIVGDKFDAEFTSRFLGMVTVGNDKFGRPEHFARWPIEYNLDSVVGSGGGTSKSTFEYVFEYLNALQYNSDGEPLFPRPSGGSLMSDDFGVVADEFAVVVANKNTVVARWLRGHVVLVLVVVGLMLWFILTM